MRTCSVKPRADLACYSRKHLSCVPPSVSLLADSSFLPLRVSMISLATCRRAVLDVNLAQTTVPSMVPLLQHARYRDRCKDCRIFKHGVRQRLRGESGHSRQALCPIGQDNDNKPNDCRPAYGPRREPSVRGITQPVCRPLRESGGTLTLAYCSRHAHSLAPRN